MVRRRRPLSVRRRSVEGTMTRGPRRYPRDLHVCQYAVVSRPQRSTNPGQMASASSIS